MGEYLVKSRRRMIFALVVGIAVLGLVKHQVDLTKSGNRGGGQNISKPLDKKTSELVNYCPIDDIEKVTLPSGLQYQDIKTGKGRRPYLGKKVVVKYVGWKENGSLFDSSYLPGRKPLEFRLGNNEVIKGWEEGVLGMNAGGKRRLIIPPELAYGKQGMPPNIEPDLTLIFDVELVKVR